MEEDNLFVWTIYKKDTICVVNNVPFTYAFAAIKWITLKEGPKMTDDFIASDNLQKIREALSMKGLFRLGRQPGDGEDIIESWI